MAKTFENEWILEDIKFEPGFRTKKMFGGLAVYLYEKQLFVIVEPTKSGRWNWHGVLVCTDYAHHESLISNFKGLHQHDGVKKWLFIDSKSEHFEESMNGLIQLSLQNDERIGILTKRI